MPAPCRIAVSPGEFGQLGGAIIGYSGRQIGTSGWLRRFIGSFGMSPRIVSATWSLIVAHGMLDHLGPRSLNPRHLLWTLLHLKGYATEADNAGRLKCDEKTYRKWVWFYMTCLANLDSTLVSLSDPSKESCELLCGLSLPVSLAFHATDPLVQSIQGRHRQLMSCHC
jgi:hypothetical protein